MQVWDSKLSSRARLKQWTSQQSKESEAHQMSLPWLRKLCWLRFDLRELNSESEVGKGSTQDTGYS